MSTSTIGQAKRVRLKLILVIVLTAGFVTVGSLSFGIREAKRLMSEQTSEYGYSLSKGIGTACSDVLKEGDYLNLKKVIAAIGASYESIERIDVRVNGFVVSRYTREEETGDPNFVGEKGFSEYPIDVIVAGKEVNLGTVAVTYSLGRYHAIYQTQIRALAIIAGIVFIGLILILMLFLNRLIIKPLRAIEEGTKVIGSGDLKYRIELAQKDEFGLLARAFNRMSEKLYTAQEKILEWNKNLEERVKKRTEELREAGEKLETTQYQLVQSGKMAAIGLLGAGIAHELNNPLCSIIGYSEMMAEKFNTRKYSEKDTEKFKKYTNTIAHESKRCEGIVASLLQFARKSRPDMQAVDVQKAVDVTILLMEYQLRKWKISLVPSYPEGPVYINGNADKLEQVFINLIANAHHAMPDGGSIYVTVEQVEYKEGSYVRISFRDTGCGIPKENLSQLFDSFFSSEKDMNNLGLGLSISLQIVKDHNGEILVDSEVGQGTTFSLMIPEKQ